MQTRQPDVFGTPGEELVLRHYAFAEEWFKLSATFDLTGNLIQPGPVEDPFAVNCDVATPMMRIGDDIAAVDLVLDVLVDTNGSYRIVDRDEFDQAVAAGLISPSEARGAEAGLARLVQWIESGRMMSLLMEMSANQAALAPPPLPFERTPIEQTPAVAANTRPTW
jgi:protein associated with RNAse G/E